MTRGLVLLLILLAAASPARRPLLPLPPMPPAAGPPDMAAPVPDPDIRAPIIRSPIGTSISPDFFSMHYYDQSKGFTPGSRMEAKPERRPEFAPGFNIEVPLR